MFVTYLFTCQEDTTAYIYGQTRKCSSQPHANFFYRRLIRPNLEPVSAAAYRLFALG